MSYDLGTAKGRVDIDASGAVAGTSMASGAIANMRRGTIATSTALMTAGRHMTIMGGLAVAGFGLAVNAAAKFEKEMSNFKAISEATDEQMDSVRETALRLGRDTVFSANEAAQAMSELSKAGLTTDEVLNGAADAAVALAAAGGVDIPTAATVAANAMNTFNISAEDMMDVADSFAGTANRTATDVGELAEAIRYTGASASLLNIPIEDVNTALGILANRGLRGSIAGTNLNRMLINLQPSSDKAAEAMRDLGIITEDGANQFFTAEGKAKSLGEISQVLQNSLRGLTDQQKIQKLETIFGSRALQAATALAEEGAVGFNRLKRQIGNVSAEEVAAEKLDNLSGSVEFLRGSVETLLINAGTAALGPLTAFVDKLAEWVNVLAEVNPEILSMGLYVIGAIGGVLLLAGAFTYLTGAFMKFKLAMQLTGLGPLLVNPWFLVIVAIIAVVAALVWAYFHFQSFRDRVDAIIQDLRPTFEAIREWVLNAFRVFMDEILPQIIAFGRAFISTMDSIIGRVMSWGDEIREAVMSGVRGITAVWDWLWAQIGPVVEAIASLFAVLGPKIASVFKAIFPIIRGVFDAVKTIVTTAGGIIVRAWNLFGDNIVTAVMTAWNFIRSIISAVMQVIRGIIETITGVITGDWSRAWNGIKSIFQGIWNAIFAYLTMIWSNIRNVFMIAMDAVRLVWHEGWNAIRAVVVAVWQAVRGIILAGWNVIQGIWHGALNFITSAWNAAWRNVTRILRSAWNGIKSGVQTGVSAVVGFLRALPGRAIAAIASIVRLMLQKGRESLRAMRDGVVAGWESVVSFLGSIPRRVLSAIGDLGSTLLNAGRELIEGLISGVRDAIPGLSSVLDGVSSLIPSWKGPPERDAVLLRPNGRLIMGGLIRGIQDEMPALERFLASVGPTMTNDFIPMPGSLHRNRAMPTGAVTHSTRQGDTFQTNVRTDADPDEIMDAFKWMSAVKVNRKRVGAKP